MENLKIHILRKLYRHTYIGRRHTAITNLQQGLPSHKRNMKNIKNTVKELFATGFLLLHKSNTRVSLNPLMLDKIKNIIFS